MEQDDLNQIVDVVTKAVKPLQERVEALEGGPQRYVGGRPFHVGSEMSQKGTAPSIIHSRGEKSYSVSRAMLSIMTKDKTKAPMEWDPLGGGWRLTVSSDALCYLFQPHPIGTPALPPTFNNGLGHAAFKRLAPPLFELCAVHAQLILDTTPQAGIVRQRGQQDEPDLVGPGIESGKTLARVDRRIAPCAETPEQQFVAKGLGIRFKDLVRHQRDVRPQVSDRAHVLMGE